MRRSRLGPVVALAGLIAVVAAPAPATAWAHGKTGRMSHRAPRHRGFDKESIRTRAITALKDSIASAGGNASAESQGASKGSEQAYYPFPYLALDLDGDGAREVILRQYTAADSKDLVAVGSDGTLWSTSFPDDVAIQGNFVGDFASGGGEEALLLGARWSDGASHIYLELLGASGVVWSRDFAAPLTSFQVNGLTQADDDPQSEFSYTTWTGYRSAWLTSVDGQDGHEINT
ncbi:MAG: hypothetical protein ABR600_06355, partial [Actinomycetota bacterium]